MRTFKIYYGTQPFEFVVSKVKVEIRTDVKGQIRITSFVVNNADMKSAHTIIGELANRMDSACQVIETGNQENIDNSINAKLAKEIILPKASTLSPVDWIRPFVKFLNNLVIDYQNMYKYNTKQ